MLGRTARLVALAALLGLAVGSAAGPARAADDLVGYSLSARAPALRLILDSDALPVPAHPAVDATIPETSSTLESGPLGHGLSSFFWPGDLGGHAGSAIQQLSQLCSSTLPVAIPNVPNQCVPLPQAIKDNAQYLNDPFKAETFFPGGPVDVDYFTPPIPGVTMSSHAAEKKIESLAGFGFGVPGVGTVSSIQSRSITSQEGGKATSDASSELFNVALAGGLVTIDHIASTAKQTTDGVAVTGNGGTVVSGLRIGGVPATIDRSGLRIGALTGLANQALRNLGLELKITAPDVVTDGAKGSFEAPVLVISYRDDQNALEKAAVAMGQKLTTGALQPLTGSLQQLALGPQAKVTLALGGATAMVNGSPSEPLAPETAAMQSPSPEALPVPGVSAAPVPAATEVAGTTFSTPGTPAASVRTRPVAAAPRRGAGLLDGWGGLAWGLVLAAVLACLPVAYGLYRFALAADSQ